MNHRARREGLDALLAVLRERRALGAMSPSQLAELLPAADGARLLARLAADAERLGLTSQVPDWARDRLTSARVRGEAYERAVRWEVNRIHRALLPIGVRPVFLKGAAYVAAGLPCSVGRVVADVDILVPETELPRVQSALQNHGWQFTPLDPYDDRYYREWMHELPPLQHGERGTVLDVHHRILPRTGRVHPPTDHLLASAIEFAGTRVLCPEHMVLHSAAHLFQDGQVAGALRDVLDIRDLLETFGRTPDFERRLTAAAKVLDLGRPLYYAVRYSRMVGLTASYPGVNAWRPLAPVLGLMDGLVKQTLIRPPGLCASLAALALYTRSHWLRMPTGLLIRHLYRKALSR